MKVTYWHTRWYLRAEICSDDRQMKVGIFRGEELGEKVLGPVEIAWSSYGPQNVERTLEYSAMLGKAVDIAKRFDKSAALYQVDAQRNNQTISSQRYAASPEEIREMLEADGWTVKAIAKVAHE